MARAAPDQNVWSRSPSFEGSMWGDRSRWQARARPVLWLLVLAAPLSAVYDSSRPVSALHAAVVYTVAGLFAASFAVLNLLPDEHRNDFSRRTWMVLSAWFVGLITFLGYYDGGWWAYMYTFVIIPAVRATRRGPQTVIGLTCLAGVVAGTSGLGAGNVWGPLATVGGGGFAAIAFWRLNATNEELRQARDDLARVAVADERLRFARDLHDLLGHSLSVITLKSEVAGRLLPDHPDRAHREVAEIEGIAREALREVREAVSGYRQATVAVEVAGARTALAAASIAWSEDIQVPDLPPEIEGPLAWAVREGVTNVIRHSGAHRCRLTIRTEGDSYVATVTDDGTGLPAEVASGSGWLTGNGLRGLAERLALAGGSLEAGPVAGGGFRLRASVPRSTPTAPLETTPPDPIPSGVADPAPAETTPPAHSGVAAPAPAAVGPDRR